MLIKEKEKLSKARRRRKQVTYKRTTIKQKISYPQTKEFYKPFINIFKVLRENKHSPIILHPAKLSFKNEGKIKTFLHISIREL